MTMTAYVPSKTIISYRLLKVFECITARTSHLQFNDYRPSLAEWLKHSTTAMLPQSTFVVSNFQHTELFSRSLELFKQLQATKRSLSRTPLFRTFTTSNQLFGPLNCFSLVISNFCSSFYRTKNVSFQYFETQNSARTRFILAVFVFSTWQPKENQLRKP